MEHDNSWFAFAPGFGSFQPLGFLMENSLGNVRGDFCVSVGAAGPGVRGCCASGPWALLGCGQQEFPSALTQVGCAGVAPLSPLLGGSGRAGTAVVSAE